MTLARWGSNRSCRQLRTDESAATLNADQPAFGHRLLVGQDHRLAIDVQQLRHFPRAGQQRSGAQASLDNRAHQTLDDLSIRRLRLRPIEFEQRAPFAKLDHMNYPKLEVLLVLV